MNVLLNILCSDGGYYIKYYMRRLIKKLPLDVLVFPPTFFGHQPPLPLISISPPTYAPTSNSTSPPFFFIQRNLSLVASLPIFPPSKNKKNKKNNFLKTYSPENMDHHK